MPDAVSGECPECKTRYTPTARDQSGARGVGRTWQDAVVARHLKKRGVQLKYIFGDCSSVRNFHKHFLLRELRLVLSAPPLDTSLKFRVLVVDGVPLTRGGLISLIHQHPMMLVCAEAGNAPAARQLCEREKPNIVVLDGPVQRGDEIELLHDFRKLHPPARTLILSDREDAFSVQRAFRAGARAYVSKQDEAAALLAALELVVGGGLFASPRVLHVLLEDLAHGGERWKERALGSLSDRELQVFRLLGRGLGATAIARELTLSVKTVETHQARMKQKLHLSSGADLRREAMGRTRQWLAQRPMSDRKWMVGVKHSA